MTEARKQKDREKCMRYYYRHREALLEKRRQKQMEDPEYHAKQAAKEAEKAEREARAIEREIAKAIERATERVFMKLKRDADWRTKREEEKETRRRLKASQVGISV